jgi:signal recognition particle subunit SRP54
MVLAELGGKLRESLRKLHAASASGLDTRVLDTLLSEISRALIESDVNVKLVMTLRNNIKNRVGESLRHHEENSGGASSAQNIVKLVQKSVTDELIALLSPENVKPYVMKKNKPNVILFVGLQGAGMCLRVVSSFVMRYSR